ncbi:MAG: hypothetical protein HUJ54_10245 [Erysipelotrichaceae bacterium]|nr:hypothetical protein [Erysipelotrichaceae bacterium]
MKLRPIIAAAFMILLTACASKTQTAPKTDACSETSSKACDAADSAEKGDYGFIPMEFDDAVALFKEGKSGLLYFGFPDCPWCKEAVPILQQEAEAAGVDVYYIRTRDDERNRLYSDEQKEQIIPYLKEYMDNDEDGVLTLYVPVIVAVKDGKVTAGHVGTVDGHNAKAGEMTAEQKKQAEAQIQTVVDAAKAK